MFMEATSTASAGSYKQTFFRALLQSRSFASRSNFVAVQFEVVSRIICCHVWSPHPRTNTAVVRLLVVLSWVISSDWNKTRAIAPPSLPAPANEDWLGALVDRKRTVFHDQRVHSGATPKKHEFGLLQGGPVLRRRHVCDHQLEESERVVR